MACFREVEMFVYVMRQCQPEDMSVCLVSRAGRQRQGFNHNMYRLVSRNRTLPSAGNT